jgi:hypothetical protein
MSALCNTLSSAYFVDNTALTYELRIKIAPVPSDCHPDSCGGRVYRLFRVITEILNLVQDDGEDPRKTNWLG